MTHKERFGHANGTNRSSYLNIICIKLVTQVKKPLKTEIQTFYLRCLFFLIQKPKKLKLGLSEIFSFKKNEKSRF